MTSFRAVLLFVAASAATTAVACTESTTTTDTSPTEAANGVPDACFVRKAAPAPVVAEVGDAGTLATTPGPAPSEPIRCVDDTECGAGARCDKALSPPRCVVLYCVPEEGACSAVEQCIEGMKCHEGRCNSCKLCGNLCEVDFTSDPKNCGGCGKAIAAAQTCVGGEATCPPGRSTLCGDECVDTKTDDRHCGACDRRTPKGGSCTKGKPSCTNEQEICDGTCADLQKDLANCGACGHVCPGDLTCNTGYCYAPLSSTTPEKCFDVCQAAGLRCAGAAAVFTSTSSPTKFVDLACGALPGAAPAGFAFNSMSCACIER